MQKKHFCLIFLIIIYIFFLMYPISFILIRKNIITTPFSNIINYQKLDGNKIDKYEQFMLNIRNNLNNKLTNYLFLYNNVNQLYPNVQRKINNIFYKNIKPCGQNADNEYIYFNKNNNFYFLQSNKNMEFINKNMKNNLKFYNEIVKDYEVFMFLPNRYEFRNNTRSLYDMKEIKEKFLKNLSKDVVIKNFSVDNYNENFYKTDHHWNAYGAINGYNQICEMMNIKPRSLDFVKTNKKFIGSIAKSVSDNNNFDYFSYISTKLKYNKKLNDNLLNKHKPEILKETNNIYYDYYVGYYNGLYDEVMYEYDNDKENLLIIGDSYSWPIDYIIASHFHKTFVLNPMLIGNIDLKSYMKKNNINKILFLMETQTLIYDDYNYNFNQKLGGK